MMLEGLTGITKSSYTGDDLISRQAAIDECDKQYPNIDRQDFKAVINAVPSAEVVLQTPQTYGKSINPNAEIVSDIISRQDAIDAIRKFQTYKLFEKDNMLLVDQAEVMTELMMLPSADRPTGWTTEQVAEMLANLLGDECACNWSGIDEWLPLACKYADTQCPDPKEKHGCWMQFLIQGGGTGE